MFNQKYTKKASVSLDALKLVMSNLTDTRADCKLIDQTDIESLVQIDEACFENAVDNASKFREEILKFSSYGIIIYGNLGKGSMEMRSPLAYIIAHHDEENIAAFNILKDSAKKGSYLVSCAVVPEVQRRGVLRNMLACFEDVTKIQGIDHIRLHTMTSENPNNNGAYKAFLKLGFEVVGIKKVHHDKADDVYEMLKLIN